MSNLLICFILLSVSLYSAETSVYNQTKDTDWTFTRKLKKGPRGGTSEGTPVKIIKEASKSWKMLKEKNISPFERDRRAIIALAGEFKVSFEFLETILIDTKLDKDIPYASWATEFVKVVEQRADFIALQHIIVMFMKDPETGETIGPMMVKHWRQEWDWEPTDQLVFQGDNHWKIEKLNRNKSKGKWKWTVYQVDDTPRYSMLGSWTHLKSASMFNSEIFTRPLPRREFSVRSDYKLLLGHDNLILTANSWFHEQKNFKHKGKLGEENATDESSLLSREIGHNSYLRIKDFDFSAGYEYWEKTKPYWTDVVEVWREITSQQSEFKLKTSVNGKKLFQVHFANANDEIILKMSSEKRRMLIRNLLKSFMK